MKNLLFLLGFCILNYRTTAQVQTNISTAPDPFLEEDDFEEDFPSVVSLKFHLKEELLAELFTEIALQNFNCNFKDCSISLIDISEATQLSRFSSNDLSNTIKILDISSTDFYNVLIIYPISAKNVEELLKTFKLTFSELYKTFLDSLENPSKTVPDILTAVNVSVMDFMNAIAYGNDSIRLQVLATGNYSQENLETVLKLSNKTGSDILDLVPLQQIFRNLKAVDAQDFTNFVKNLGVTSAKLSNFYRHLNITAINFLSYPPFIGIITDYYDYLNAEEALGVFVSHTKIYTSKKANALTVYINKTIEIVKRYAAFHAELVENPLVQYDVQNVALINPEYQTDDLAVIEVKNSFATVFSNVSNSFTPLDFTNCTYVSKIPYGLFAEKVSEAKLVNSTIIIPKTSTTVFNYGSPLFCREQLCGLASEDASGVIKLSALIKKKSPQTTAPAGQKTEVSEKPTTPNLITVSEPELHSSSTSLLSFNVLYILIISIIFSLLV